MLLTGKLEINSFDDMRVNVPVNSEIVVDQKTPLVLASEGGEIKVGVDGDVNVLDILDDRGAVHVWGHVSRINHLRGTLYIYPSATIDVINTTDNATALVFYKGANPDNYKIERQVETKEKTSEVIDA